MQINSYIVYDILVKAYGDQFLYLYLYSKECTTAKVTIGNYKNKELKNRASFFSFFLRSPCMKYASYEYRNRSVRRGTLYNDISFRVSQ